MRTEIKVCGLTREEDIALAVRLGSSFIGLNRYFQSPRYVDDSQSRNLIRLIPEERRVAVDVQPDTQRIAQFKDEGFDWIQIHFKLDTPEAVISQWSTHVSPSRLWLAPKLPPDVEAFPTHLLPYADIFLIDGYSADVFGGTGKTSNWERFALWKKQFPTKRWVLAGGLSPDNIQEALSVSQSRHIDVNSGVETQPGQKCPTKLEKLFRRVRTYDSQHLVS